MSFAETHHLSYIERLATFLGCWDEHGSTARQLAAVGHICDRPPIEALEDGSHCVSCNAFVLREHSVRALEGPLSRCNLNGDNVPTIPNFHHPNCIRLQIRIPLECQTTLTGSLSSFRMNTLRNLWEHRSKPQAPLRRTDSADQRSSLFSLPTELRLQIYSMVLPKMDPVTSIVPLHRDTARVITHMGSLKTGPRDMTKINLLLACSMVWDEAHDLLFTNVTYKFESTKLLYLFLRHIGAHGRALLKAVDVSCGHREDAIAFALLAECPKLRAITIRLQRPVLILPRAPIWIVDGVACLLEMSGLEHVYFGQCRLTGMSFLDETKADAVTLRREITRPRGENGTVRWVDGYPDL